jgi:hypothetical protein
MLPYVFMRVDRRHGAANDAARCTAAGTLHSSIDMYNNDVGKESAQKFMKQTGDLKAATLYFAS